MALVIFVSVLSEAIWTGLYQNDFKILPKTR
jgi:hypothetical protein